MRFGDGFSTCAIKLKNGEISEVIGNCKPYKFEGEFKKELDLEIK